MAISVILAGMKETDWSKILDWPGYKVVSRNPDRQRTKMLLLHWQSPLGIEQARGTIGR